jgi:hypothetical protein
VDEHEESVPARDERGAGRRAFLMMAGGAAAGGVAATVAPGALGVADADTGDVTIDQLPPPPGALTGAEVLHGVQTTPAGVTADMALSLTQLQQWAVQTVPAIVTSTYTWAPGITSIVGTNQNNPMTVYLPGIQYTVALPTITVVQMQAGQVTIAPLDSTAAVHASVLTGTSYTNVRTRTRWSVAFISALPVVLGKAQWVVSGDVQPY